LDWVRSSRASFKIFCRDASVSTTATFEEKKAAYVGLLEAYHLAAIERTEVAGKHFAYWQVRCDLVAPAAVREATARIVATNDDRDGRIRAQDALIEAMRADLGIGPR
jgi:hypothetical protein